MIMDKYCDCTGSCSNESKNMYSADYDSVIDSLKHTRDEIDTLIRQLENRKNKDKVINDILSSDFEDEMEKVQEPFKRYKPKYFIYPYYDYVGDLPRGYWSIYPTVTRTHFKK